MNKEIVIAKVKRWQAELSELIATLGDEGKAGPILDILNKRVGDLDSVVDTINDNSFISPGDVNFEPAPVVNEIEEKVKRVKEGVKKLEKLSKEEKKIIDNLEKDV